MAMDHFLEEVVVKQKKGLNEVLYYFSWVVMFFSAIVAVMGINSVIMSLSMGAFSITSLIFTLVTGGIAAYTFFFQDRLRTEYEYTFTNGALDFAEVYNNKKRKSLGSLNVKNVEAFGKVSGKNFQKFVNTPNIKKMNWFLNREAELYYFCFSKETNKKMIIFEPSEEMVSNIKFYLPYGVNQE